MTAFYGANWTDKFKDHVIGHILIKSWYMALKSYSEEFIMNALIEYHHEHEFAPNSPSSLLESMKAKDRRAKEEQNTQKLLADLNQKRIEHEAHETRTKEEIAHHKAAMADLDKMRALVGLPPFDEKKFKAGELVMDGKAHHYLNMMYKATGQKPKYKIGVAEGDG